MKKLFKNWRKYITEQQDAITPDPLFFNKLLDSIVEGQIFVSSGLATYKDVKLKNGNTVSGELRIKVPSQTNDGPCLTARKIDWVKVEPQGGGWGALLYEIMLEAVTKNNSYLMPDRWSTQPEAVNIWKKFMSRVDIEKIPLDTLYNNFTPDNNEDNCNLNMLHWYVDDANYTGRVYSDVTGSDEYKAKYSKLNNALKIAVKSNNKEQINAVRAQMKNLATTSNKFKNLIQTDLQAAKKLANSNPFGLAFRKNNTNVIDYGVKTNKVVIK